MAATIQKEQGVSKEAAIDIAVRIQHNDLLEDASGKIVEMLKELDKSIGMLDNTIHSHLQ